MKKLFYLLLMVSFAVSTISLTACYGPEAESSNILIHRVVGEDDVLVTAPITEPPMVIWLTASLATGAPPIGNFSWELENPHAGVELYAWGYNSRYADISISPQATGMVTINVNATGEIQRQIVINITNGTIRRAAVEQFETNSATNLPSVDIEITQSEIAPKRTIS